MSSTIACKRSGSHKQAGQICKVETCYIPRRNELVNAFDLEQILIALRKVMGQSGAEDFPPRISCPNDKHM